MEDQSALPSEMQNPVTHLPGFSYGFSKQQPPIPPAGFKQQQQADNLTRFNSYTMVSSSELRVLAGANTLRKYLAIQNVGTQLLFVGFGTAANLNGSNSIQIPPGTGFTFDSGIVPNNEISVISAGDSLVAVLEGSMA